MTIVDTLKSEHKDVMAKLKELKKLFATEELEQLDDDYMSWKSANGF